jgi:iron(III) transport system permease protein
VLERTNLPGRNILYAAALVPLVIPGVVTTIAWMLLLSPKIGLLNLSLVQLLGLSGPPFDIYSLPGMIWVEGLNSSPILFLLLAAALRSMNPALEEASLMSGASWLQAIRRVTLPLLMPAAAAALLLAFVRSIESFEVPALIGIPVGIYMFSSRIYEAVHVTPPDYGLGSAHALALLTITLLGMLAYYRLTRAGAQFQTITGKGYRPRLIDMGRWKYVGLILVGLYLVLLIGLPVLVIGYSSLVPFYGVPSPELLSRISLDNYAYIFTFEPVRRAFGHSVVLALSSAAAVMLLTTVVAWLTVRSRVPGRKLLDVFAFAPIAIPGVVMGLALQRFYVSLPLPIYGTLWVLLLAFAARFMPYGVRIMSAAMGQLHSEIEEAAEMSGGSWTAVFRRIVFPLLWPPFLAGAMYIIIISFRELASAILLIGADSTVLSVLIFDLWENGAYTRLAALSLMLAAFTAVLVLMLRVVGGRLGLRNATI